MAGRADGVDYMTPAGHLSVSYISGKALRNASVPAVVLGGILPDLDFIFIFFDWFNQVHRVLTHNLLFVLLFSAAGFLAAPGDRRKAVSAGLFTGGILHLLIDSCINMETDIPVNVSPGSADVPERLRALDNSQPHAVLATVSDGLPYTSLVAFRFTSDLKGIIFATPRATRKYRSILKNRNVSVLVDNRSNTLNDYLGAEAVTAAGTARPVRRGRKRDKLAVLLMEKHPALKEFINAPGTALVLVDISVYQHVGGFQETTRWSP